MVGWTLVFHLAGLVFWLGSLLVVTHVLAVHAEEPSREAQAALGRLEMKLLKGLTHPGAAIMVVSGILLLVQLPFALRELWFYLKLLLVVVLIVLDLRVYFLTKAFIAGRIVLRRRDAMVLHGAIAAVFLSIIVLVLIKPFT